MSRGVRWWTLYSQSVGNDYTLMFIVGSFCDFCVDLFWSCEFGPSLTFDTYDPHDCFFLFTVS